MKFTCVRCIVISTIIVIVLGFLVLGIGIGVARDQSEPSFYAALGCGLGLICLGVILMLVCLCVVGCQTYKEFHSTSPDGRYGRTQWEPSPQPAADNEQTTDEYIHNQLAAFLHEECVAYDETDLPTVADKLMDKWHLNHEFYTIFDVALLARTLHDSIMYNNVRDVAQMMIRRRYTNNDHWLTLGLQFTTDLLMIKSEQQPEHYSACANIYTLLKTRSRNTNGRDHSPLSSIRQCDIAAGAPTVTPPRPQETEVSIPDTPPPPFPGTQPHAPPASSRARPPPFPVSTDNSISQPPPSYSEAVNISPGPRNGGMNFGETVV